MKNKIKPIRSVAFDIDGTLYSNASMYRVTTLHVLRHLRLFRAFGHARKQVRREYPVTDLAARTTELTAQELGWDVPRTRERIQTVIYTEWERLLGSVKLYPGVRDFIIRLRSNGIPTAAMSDFPTEGKLKLLGLDGLWDVSFSSEETQYLKPRREPFDRLVRELACPAETILYVGNSYTYDVIGAKEAGMCAAHLTRRPPRDSRADFSFFHYRELENWLEPRLVPREI